MVPPYGIAGVASKLLAVWEIPEDGAVKIEHHRTKWGLVYCHMFDYQRGIVAINYLQYDRCIDISKG
jgi:hypothetical protein